MWRCLPSAPPPRAGSFTTRPGMRRFAQEIAAAYRALEQKCGAGVAVAVRSSATAEDLPTASFAGQHESFLNVRGEDDVVEACRRCFASIFTDRAIVYRIDNGFDHFKVALSVGVMKMVRSDLAASGVIFTLDTESGFRDVVFVTGSWGLGENIVQGKVDPDEFYVHKPTFRQGYRAVLSRALGGKQLRLVYARGHGDASTRNVRDAAGRARDASASPIPRCWSSRIMRSASRTITRSSPVSRRRWTSNGPRMARTASSTSSRPGPKPWPRSATPRPSRPMR